MVARRGVGWTKGEGGASAVEFALVLLVLVLVLVGISQFGILFYQWLEMEHAAREGARWGSIHNAVGHVGDPDSVRGKVAAAAPGLNPPLTDADITVNPASDTLFLSREPITVTVTHASPILPLMGAFLGTTGPTITLQATAVQMIE